MANDTPGTKKSEVIDKDAASVEKEKKALIAIRKLRQQIQQLEYRQREPIAIIGLSCRLPMASDADDFWQLLDAGVDATGEVPAERWDVDSYYDPDPDAKGKVYTRRGAYLDKIEEFDANFFGISPREAKFMDPQQRILLEQAWSAVEDAGIAIKDLAGTRTGVFVGVTACDYAMMIQEAYTDPGPYYITGNTLNVMAGRLAYVLRLQGPAMAIDTACSSSLVSVHQACLSLRNGESNLALAGGVNLLISPRSTIATCRSHMLSPDGRCKTFDASADGYARGEGCGVLVLKRLSDAERDGDRVLALVRGSAVNQDGRSSGLTVPNGPAQQKVIGDALRAAGLSGSDVQYLEAHGTGTSLGDPIEIQSAAAVLACDRDASAPLLVGSAKTNIGHLEAAAGVAGLIKVVLSLKHGRIPRHLHFTNPSPHIPWDVLNLRVTAEAVSWPEGKTPRIAGVSSFGFSGTNAHVVIEEAPVKPVEDGNEDEPAESNLQMLTLSGRTSGALRQLAINYDTWLERHNDVSLIDVCYTANTGRNHLEHRAALVFDSAEQLRKQLVALGHGGFCEGLHVAEVRPTGAKPKVAFLFTGQGSQYAGMGRDLYERETVFRQMLDRCATAFDDGRGEMRALGLLDVMFGEHEDKLHQTGYTQPALFALEVSLAALWRSWGLEPAVVLGHSVGEYSAACVAGHFSVESGLALIAERSRLMQALPSGGIMASVYAPAQLVEAAASGDDALFVAAYNGPECVLSGPQLSVEAALERLRAQGHRCTVLRTSHAFHSALMDPMLEPFRLYANDVDYQPLQVPLISNVSGEIMKVGRVPDATYWTEHVRSPVRFTQCIEALGGIGCTVVLEIGPHPVLTPMGQRCWAASVTAAEAGDEPVWVASLRREYNDEARMLSAAADLFVGGIAVDFAALEGKALARRFRVSLPTYPFQRQRYWIDLPESAQMVAGPGLEDCLYRTVWQQRDVDPSSTQQDGSGSWLVFCDEGGTGKAVCELLKARGDRVVQVDANSRESRFEQTLAECIDDAWKDGPIQKVLYLGCLDSASIDSVQDLQRAQELGVESVLRLTQILIDREWEGQLWLVTRGVQRVLDSDRVEPAQSTLWGLGKVISMERPRSWGGLVDLPLDAGGASVAEQLVSVCDCADFEDQVALREGRRWVTRLLPEENLKPAQLEIEREASYLITGGLGGIGLQIAHRLVQRGARYLVLTSRGAASQAAQTAIRALEEQGCDIHLIRGDVSQENDVLRLFDEIQHLDLPVLKGIVHAAGIESVVALEEVTVGELQAVMAAKVFGAWLLDRITLERGIELSFFVCTSSIASVWGSLKQASYAAGNAFLTALCEHRLTEGRAATAVCYGPWKEVGMGLSEDGQEWLRSRGIRALSSRLGLDGLEAMIMGGVSGTTQADINWSIFRSVMEILRPRPLLESLGDDEEAVDPLASDETRFALESLRAASESERPTLLATIIRDEVSRVLGTGPDVLGDDVSWFELGMDSLMLMEVTNRLRRRFGDDALSAEVVYQQPTVGKLKTVLMDSLNLSRGETSVGEAVEVADDAGLSANDAIEWPASIGQKRVWFLQQMTPTSPQFNLPLAVRFKKGLSVDLAERVLGELARRHSALRTTIGTSNGELVQVVQQWSMPELRVVDLEKDVDLEDRLKSIEEQEASRPIDIMGASLFRVTLVNLSADDQVLLITLHHAISDGVSNGMLLREFLALYEAFGRDEQSPLPQPKAQFVDYAAHQSRQLLKPATSDSVAYWKEELRAMPPLEMPSERVRPAVQSHVGDSVAVNLSADIQAELRACSQRAGVTHFVTLLAAWSLLLSRYSGQKDFGVGTPVAGRDGPEWSDAIGFFVNMLTLRLQLDKDWTVAELLAHAEAVTRRAFEHQALPFDWLVEQLNPTRDPSRTPLFQAALILQVSTREFEQRLDSEGIVITDLRPMLGASQLDLTLDLRETNAGFGGFLEYNTDLFDRWRIEQMVEHFKILLSAMIRQPDARISTLPMLSASERQRLLLEWNATETEYPQHQCIHQLFEAWVGNAPEATAVVFEDQSLTYAELNTRANQLAHHLRSLGIGPDVMVGICLERSLEMVVGVLGILKAGGAYVPLDPAHPKDRLGLMLDDFQPPIVVTQQALLSTLPTGSRETVCLDRDRETLARRNREDPVNCTEPKHLAYVIYTSGSTGKPKGTLITHANVTRLFAATQSWYDFNQDDVWTLFHSYGFDFSVWEMWGALLYGGRLVVVPYLTSRSPEAFYQLLCDAQVTVLNQTPMAFNQLARVDEERSDDRLHLRLIIFGGDALDIAKLESWFLRHGDEEPRLVNMYGITETTVHVTYRPLTRMDVEQNVGSVIGRAIPDLQIYILDEFHNPVPVGVAGELYIGGAGLARGYLNRPELTAETFIPHAFSATPGERLYRSGDLARYLPDGGIEFLGRIDHQVKIRGFRIELGEIEDTLRPHPGVRESVVLAREDTAGDKRLVAYIVAAAGTELEVGSLRAYLKEKLPDYMLPSAFVFLDALPLTPNGKVDRKALPAPEGQAELVHAYVAPRTPTEERLAGIWAQVLAIERVGVHDNFFDLGGHSLLIVQILARLNQQHDFKLTVADLYQFATVEALAEYVERRSNDAEQSEASASVPTAVGTSPLGEQTLQHRTQDGNVYTYRRYREGDKTGALASFADAFGSGPASVQGETFDWKYLDSRPVPDDRPLLDILECDGCVVGMEGSLPARFKIEEETMPGFWGSDTHVASDHRGVMGWIWSTSMRRNSGLCFGNTTSPALYSMLSSTNSILTLDQYINLKACLDLGNVLETRGLNPVISSVLGLGFRPVMGAIKLYASLRAERGINIAKIPQFDSRFDELWRVASRDYQAIMVRDYAFLCWRFDRCPNRQYTRYVAEKDGVIVGYMVTRVTPWQGALRGRIVDYLVGRYDSVTFDSLVRAVMQDFRSRGAVSVLCPISSTQTAQIRSLRQHGFLFGEPGSRVIVNHGSWEEKLTAIKNWFFTYADGDIDYCNFEGEGDEEGALESHGSIS